VSLGKLTAVSTNAGNLSFNSLKANATVQGTLSTLLNCAYINVTIGTTIYKLPIYN
jgi:hypothetical protein